MPLSRGTPQPLTSTHIHTHILTSTHPHKHTHHTPPHTHTQTPRRYQQSQAESSKLAGVKSELERLDQLVTKDVAILRDKIETASKDYTLAKWAL